MITSSQRGIFYGKENFINNKFNNFKHNRINYGRRFSFRSCLWIQFDDKSKKFDPAKPTLLLIHTQRCGLCVRFLPLFNKASKKYKDKYNFVALEGNDPRNYTLVQDNVTELPMVYIYDTSIGNKIHIPSTMLGDEEHFFFELDRYLHFRSLLNLEQAVKDHQEAIAKIQKK